MKIAITADSTIDLTPELLEKYDIKIVPLNILLGDTEYKDGEITSEDVFEYVKTNGVLPKTSAANETVIEEFFAGVLKKYDRIIHFDVSSSMSTTYASAVRASREFDGKVEVIDSKSLSTGTALLAIYARELTKTEKNIKTIAERVRARVDKVQASFVVEKLDYLRKGGRCTSVELLGANILKIRPQIIVKDGKMGSYKKYRGSMPMVVSKYCKDVLDEFHNPDKSVIFITCSSNNPELYKAAHEVVDSYGFENVYETIAGCTISSHCGPNTIGILYINDAE
ncbi:MAG: DegV family protein [Clostridia bacterium]|nr:DegV family protein [Clostridia bacterium]